MTWTIEPIGGKTGKSEDPTSLNTKGPVVPAMVAISTDPSMPSNAPVPPIIVPGNGGGRGGGSNVLKAPSTSILGIPSLDWRMPLPKLKTKAVPE